MTYKVVGPRLLLRVKKYSKTKDQTFEGSSILMPETQVDMETVGQTVGEVVQIGNTAYKRKDAFCDGTDYVKVGDYVHFNRYGAMRINPGKHEDCEYWVLMDKDVLVIEKIEEKEYDRV